MWLSGGCSPKCVVTLFSRRVLQSYLHVWGRRHRCNVAAFMPEAAGFEGVSDRAALQDFSVSNSESFWAAVGKQRLSWIKPFSSVQDCDLSQGRIKWFEGGKLNVSGKITREYLLWKDAWWLFKVTHSSHKQRKWIVICCTNTAEASSIQSHPFNRRRPWTWTHHAEKLLHLGDPKLGKSAVTAAGFPTTANS